jgi:hypothetical protein
MKKKIDSFLFMGLAAVTCEGGLGWRSWLGVPTARINLNQAHTTKKRTEAGQKIHLNIS